MRLREKAVIEFAHHAHARQNHDVHGGVRIEPEQMLEQERIAADGRIEDADVQRRSRPSRNSVMAMTGVPRTKMTLVAYIAQMKSGRRNQVIPGRASCES